MPQSKPEDRFQSDRNERELQADPILHEGRASRLRIWIVAIAAIVIVGLLAYGLAQNSRPRVADFPPETPTTTGKGPANAPLTQRGGANAPLNERSGTGQ
jgi:hypothetical protein